MTYTVKVFLRTEGLTDHDTGGEELTFDVVMGDPCFLAVIDLSAVVPDTAPQYTIGEPADVQQFMFASADDGVEVICPSMVFELTNQDGSALDASIFTYDGVSENLKTQSSDLAQVGEYPLRLSATLTLYDS